MPVSALLLATLLSSTDRLPAAVATNETGLQLLAAVASKSENTVVAPLSAQLTLSSLWLGANDEVRAELGNAIHLKQPADAVASQYRALIAEVAGSELQHAAKLWAGKRPQLDLVQALRNSFSTELDRLPSSPEAIVVQTNRWVRQATSGQIKEVVDQVAPNTTLVIASASTFEATWLKLPTLEKRGSGITFKPLTGDPYPVDTLAWKNQRKMKFVQTPELSSVKLPYAGGRTSLWLIVPQGEKGLAEVLKTLTASRLNALGKSMVEEGLVDVRLPKFTIVSRHDLKTFLIDRGVKSAFELGNRFPAFGGAVYLTQVLQTARIEVDEHGTRAAGATVGVGGGFGGPRSLVADRPFIYLIEDAPTGLILFAGVCGRP